MNRIQMGRGLFTLNAVVAGAGGLVADWNATHLFNPRWPPHARYHDGQIMAAGKLAEKALAKAAELQLNVAVIILDGGGRLVLVHRVDRAAYIAVEVGRMKAEVALNLQVPTHVLAGVAEHTHSARCGGRGLCQRPATAWRLSHCRGWSRGGQAGYFGG